MTCCGEEPPDVGTTVRLTQVSETYASPPTLFDPGHVILAAKDPQGTEVQPLVVRESLGVFYAEFVVPLAGQWHDRGVTENAVRVKEGSSVIRRSEYAIFDPPGGPEQLTWTEFDDMTWQLWDAIDWG